VKITKLNKVDLRQQWTHEARDFTKWLSEPDNLELLSDEIGIGIELIQIEANVGRYNVDILAQEENTGRKIIIENQLEMTDHSHLGQHSLRSILTTIKLGSKHFSGLRKIASNSKKLFLKIGLRRLSLAFH
jgi:hypothetical protein